MPFYIDVIIPLPLEQRFTYSITKEEVQQLEVGMRVAVPFGKRKVYTGIVAHIHDNPPLRYEAKPVEELLDDTPTVTSFQLKLWKWIADYYICTEGEILKSALPSALLIESETVIEPHPDYDLKMIDEDDNLTDSEYLILQALQKQSLLKISEIILILDKKTIFPVINAMAEKGLILVNQELNKQYKPKLQKYIKLADQHSSESELPKLLENLERAKKQKQALLKLFSLKAQTQKPISAKVLKDEAGVSDAIIKSLVNKSIFTN